MLDWPKIFPFWILKNLSSFQNSTWVVVGLLAPFDLTPSSGTLFLTPATYLKQTNRVTQLQSLPAHNQWIRCIGDWKCQEESLPVCFLVSPHPTHRPRRNRTDRQTVGSPGKKSQRNTTVQQGEHCHSEQDRTAAVNKGLGEHDIWHVTWNSSLNAKHFFRLFVRVAEMLLNLSPFFRGSRGLWSQGSQDLNQL